MKTKAELLIAGVGWLAVFELVEAIIGDTGSLH